MYDYKEVNMIFICKGIFHLNKQYYVRKTQWEYLWGIMAPIYCQIQAVH